MRQPPSGRRTSAGRSSDAAPKASRGMVATCSNATPSRERAIATAYPRPAPTGRRSR
jgi:hypothetical protein